MSSILNTLKDQSILILGLGREGISTYRFLRHHFPEKKLTLADAQPVEKLPTEGIVEITQDANVELRLEKRYLEGLNEFEVIFKSPGIPLYAPQIQQVVSQGIHLSSNTQLFFDLLKEMKKPPFTIGITGTKGKSTTTAFIAHVLKESGLKTVLAGNIGTPPLSQLDDIDADTYVVLELSSHQLLTLTHSPHIAVIQEITSEHLDYYPDTKTYVDAKSAIARYQTVNDFVIYNQHYPETARLAQLSPGKHITHDQYIQAHISEQETEPLWEKCPALPGKHNRNNILPACIIGEMLHLSDQQLQTAFSSFKSLPHRLQFVTRIDGIRYYNDSLSTTPEATIAAINAFENTPLVLLAGGFERHQNFSELAKIILESKQIKTLILFPTTGERIWQEVESLHHKNPLDIEEKAERSLPAHVFVETMADAVEAAREHAKPGDIVLLSPASASYNAFKNYEDRGMQFETQVFRGA